MSVATYGYGSSTQTPASYGYGATGGDGIPVIHGPTAVVMFDIGVRMASISESGARVASTSDSGVRVAQIPDSGVRIAETVD